MSTETLERPPAAPAVALCDAERRIAELRVERDKIPDDATEEQEAVDLWLYYQINDIDDAVLATSVETLAEAACVLRRLLDPLLGVSGDLGVRDENSDAIRRVLAVVEHEAGKGGAS